MTDSLKEIGIRYSYTGKGEKLLNQFLLPALKCSISYDRVTSFYTLESLISIAQGIDSLYRRRGKMRLIIGVHSFPAELAEASLRREHLQSQIDCIREAISTGVSTIEDALVKEQIATLAWMINDGLLSVKAASVEGSGIFHPKTLIFEDSDGNKVAAVGSSNETGSGLGGNYEQLMVVNSWSTNEAVEDQIGFFESLWENTNDDAIVEDISEEIAQSIVQSLGPSYLTPKSSLERRKLTDGIFDQASRMPANFFVSGQIPALFQHQERAVLDALSRWPIRVLLCDEVGLGKTFEAAAIMAFLLKYGAVKRVCILTPKAVLKQWQDELKINFDISAWLYDSASKSYVDPDENIIQIGNGNPLGDKSPGIVLMSAQYARGSAGKKAVFERSGTVLPDLLILDEAHSARVRKDISGSSKSTKMYEMLKSISDKIPHVILATATPMQKDALEYHSMLKLLGLPKIWQRPRAYLTSLKLIAGEEIPDTNDAYTAGKLLRSTLNLFKPSIDDLNYEEVQVVNGITSMDQDCDNYEMASFVQDNWKSFRRVFIKLHPAHLLTVRNTRRSLESVGYTFPKRNLIEESIDSSDDIRLFYERVYEYISTNCFAVEKALNPGKKLNTGFIKANYQQRVASSLFSCRQSLTNRLSKILELKSSAGTLNQDEDLDPTKFSIGIEIDEMAEDELLLNGVDPSLVEGESSEKAKLQELFHAIDVESTSINPLLKDLDELLDRYGDPKIIKSIEIAFQYLGKGDRVLIFSRYTDTISALLDEYAKQDDSNKYVYGIYTGDKSVKVLDGTEIACSKEEIKTGLKTGDINIMFCSDAASEGLNLQAARVLINVDVPWTPSRLEQRIGRVARLGQTADVVDIHNVWYPSSIEARMYHRIQRRLEETNLAIGEFPDVVAESIKNAILDDSESDESLAELQDIRNSIQTKALERLWSQADTETTESNNVRAKLLSICRNQWGEPVDTDGATETFIDSFGETVRLSATDGLQESVSYKSLYSHGIDFQTEDLVLLEDEDEVPCAFSIDGETGLYLAHEDIPNVILDEMNIEMRNINERPATLPDPYRLTLNFQLECDDVERPKLWVN